ncbi:MAG: hypothetical protein QOI76_785 [Frankiales bacterium]|nr:hypothetical protein [Frankiales bacterium]
MKLVRTPVPGVNDTVGQVTFKDGVAKVADDATELIYFRSAGYGIDDFDEALDAAKTNDEDPAAADDLEGLETQTGNQEDDPQVLRDVDGDGVEEVLPRKSASTDTWRAFAVEHGMHEDAAKAMTRDELVAHFTQDDDKQEEVQ